MDLIGFIDRNETDEHVAVLRGADGDTWWMAPVPERLARADEAPRPARPVIEFCHHRLPGDPQGPGTDNDPWCYELEADDWGRQQRNRWLQLVLLAMRAPSGWTALALETL